MTRVFPKTPQVAVKNPERLKARRKAAGYTQATLAELAGVGVQFISALEVGRESKCSREVALRIDAVLSHVEGPRGLKGPLFVASRSKAPWRHGSYADKKAKADALDDAALATDYEAGMTLREVAAKYDVTYETVRRRLAKADVVIRPRGTVVKK